MLEPEAVREAQELADNHGEGDLEAQFLLGWFHLYRHQALPEGDHQAALSVATEAFASCFIAGVAGLPERLLPVLSDAAVPLAFRMLQYAEVSPDVYRLSVAADLWQRIVQATPAGHPGRCQRLAKLGSALQLRFGRTGRLEDLDAAIVHLREAVATTPADHPDRAWMLAGLGASLQFRFGRTGRLEDLETAITVGREAVATMRAGHPDHAGTLSNLVAALQARFERTGKLEDLDAAIVHLREAVATTPADHPNRATMLSHLGADLQARFERTGRLEDLKTAVTVRQEAVTTTPADHPELAMRLSNLGAALQLRFRQTGRLEDLDAAIVLLREAVATTPADHPNRATMLSNLGAAVRLRFGRTGRLEDLETAVTVGREAVATTPAGHPDRARMLSNLGDALQARFERTGRLEDIETAVTVGREAVATTPAGHPQRAWMLSTLGNALQVRFERTGMVEDMDTAVKVGREAVAITVGTPDHAIMLAALGLALQARFERTGVLEDLDAAIVHLREAVDTTPADHPDRAMRLSNLGVALRARFGRTGTLEDLDIAVTVGQEAVDATPADHPDRAMRLSNLGVALRARFERTGTLEDLDIAVTVGQEAVDATPGDHPECAKWLANLGVALRARFERTGRREDLDTAVSRLLEASEVSTAPPSLRVREGGRAAGLLAQSGDVGRAAEVAEAAVRLLPQVAPRRLERGDQQHAVGGFAGFAGKAAALSLSAPGGTPSSRAERALSLLEAGRAVLLSQALETRSDLTDLREHHPGLALKFAELREQLDASTSTVGPTEASTETDGLSLQQDRLMRDRHQLAEEFTVLLTEIRSLDGFRSFALPPTTDELLAQASQGPVVVFNISDLRSDALLLTTEGITSLKLPQLTPDKVIDQINTFRWALHLATAGADSSQREKAQATLVEVLQWLWDAAAGPVLIELGYDGAPAVGGWSGEEKWPRVWWAPGGLLSLLPLHAAGHHTDSADDPHRRTVMDRVISSYTPTVRALRYARERTLSPAAVRSLIVAMPTTPGLPNHGRLRFVEAEATMVQTRLLAPVLLREPAPTDGFLDPTRSMPTKANVLEHMPECAIVHFACHGASDPTDPSKSHLLLHDHRDDPLTVASLAPVVLGRARLAYLSACRTAAIDTSDLLDEAIHLTSAFQLAGFPHVVGTLWEIDDQIAVTIADLFYTDLQTDSRLDPAQAAHALHSAVRKVRDGHGLRAPFDRRRAPLLWAAYLHAGA
ncbi:CHAT domain-containing protein [Streptomyces sp. NBC_00490]|uniref:CHAT domain-containing protein n=1 Tax=Streptomyces sp. NBC_00490 TaxID=2903657 RepID=UPI002E18765D